MYILAYKKPSYISSFKIQGNYLAGIVGMNIKPVEDCIVDFGDGTKQTYTGNTGDLMTRVRHSYSTSDMTDIYTIKIIGNHSYFIAPENTIEIVQLSNSILGCMFYECHDLTVIPETLTIPNSVTSCAQMFYNCSITTIPETLIIPNSVTSCAQMFYNCSITTIPETLIIPNSVTTCSEMFYECSNLTSDISNIWPSTWNYTGTIDLSNMFGGCSKVVGTVPADKLWNSGKTFTSSGCFGGCTLLTNYSEIPAGWK